MNKEFVICNMAPYYPTFATPAWTLDSVQHPSWKPFYYLFMEKPLTEMGIDNSIKYFKDIDKSKTWFIPLNVNQGSWDWVEEDLWTGFPEELLNELINGNAYLLMNNENEYDTLYVINVFYKMYYKNPKVPINKLIFLTPAADGEKIYKKFVSDQKLENVFKILYAPHIDFTFNEKIVRETEYVDTTNKGKKYLCLNRAFRLHRPALVSLLAAENILDRGYVSLGVVDSEEQKMQQNGGNWKSYLNNLFLNLPWENIPEHFKIKQTLRLGVPSIAEKIPMCLDKTEFVTNYAQWDTMPVELIKDSYFSVVTSTHFFKWQEPSPGWNEKEWKPILAKHPFIIAGRPHMLKHMRRFGILTFDRWFDESYDDIEDDWTRMSAITKEMRRLSMLSNDEWDRMKQEMATVLEYNRNVIIDKRWELLFYASDLKKLITYL